VPPSTYRSMQHAHKLTDTPLLQGPTPKTAVQDDLPDFFSAENFADLEVRPTRPALFIHKHSYLCVNWTRCTAQLRRAQTWPHWVHVRLPANTAQGRAAPARAPCR
jgi:hypothetical protein